MRQVVLIHGGDTFSSYEAYLENLRVQSVDFERLAGVGPSSWSKRLQEDLGDRFLVIAPRMPNSQNARFIEWRMWFEKLIPHLADGLVLIGNSLGGVFLAKYLSENEFPKKIAATFLVAAPYADETRYSLGDFAPPDTLTQFEAQSDSIFLYHSEDDPIVPFTELDAYRARLPKAIVRTFTNRGHFYTEETFPELVHDIEQLA